MILVYPEFNAANANELSKNLGFQSSIEVKTRVFPNGEVLARLSRTDTIAGNDVCIFFSTYPNTNTRLQLLYQTLETLNYYGAREISLILPYLSYSRQDKRFLEGEALSLKLIIDFLKSLNVSNLLTVNPHNKDALLQFSKGMKITIIDVFNELVSSALKLIGNDAVLVAPDMGRCDDVKRLGEALNITHVCLEKRRDRVTGEVTISLKNVFDINGKKVLIVDDEISTGGTISKAAKLLKKLGAKHVYVAAIHLLLVKNAVDRLNKAGISAIFGTNTISNPYSILKVEPLIAKSLSTI